MRTLIRVSSIALLLTFCIDQPGSYAQDPGALEPGALLTVDPKIRTGQLSNGIKYYIRKNTKPEKRAELRVALNAGSLMENDDQQGLAHLVEHMAFNGTKNNSETKNTASCRCE